MTNQSNSKKLYLIIYVILFSLFLSSHFYNNLIDNHEKYHSNTLFENLPITSDSEITIITPENKTYTEPMSGYYPALYGFECDKIGSYPKGFNISDLGGTVNIIAELANHKNLVEISDTSSTDGASIMREFELQNRQNGTIEFWFRTTDHGSNKQQYIHFWKKTNPLSEDNAPIGITIRLDGWWNRYGGIIPNVPVLANNKWFHCRIDFECTTGGYSGLNQYEWRFIVDGVDSGPLHFWHNIDEMDIMSLGTGSNPSGMTCYIDAIGYSWDPDYNIGDNFNEGMLLSYENSTNLEWKGYSLDGQANRTILGNTTFPISDNGSHTIQVFGNDSVGTIYESDLRHFTYGSLEGESISIITPENKTYTDPMSGYYLGSFGFENNKVGEPPSDWVLRIPDGSSYYDIDNLLDGHRYVFESRKNGGTDKVEAGKDFLSNSTAGTIEFWLYKDTDSGTDGTRIHIHGTGGGGIIFNIENKDLSIGYYTERVIVANDIFEKNTWYHIGIDFEISLGWQIRVNDVYYGSGYSYPFRFNPTDIYAISFPSLFSGCHPNYAAWVDAIGYSWDPDYNIGDNLNEGLLLSFENDTNFDWIGYSLDGQANRTIMGNSTIPMPANGTYTIQLFANDSVGNIYSSDIRHFSVGITDTPIPPTVQNGGGSSSGGISSTTQPEDNTLLYLTIITLSVCGTAAILGVVTHKFRKQKIVVEPKPKMEKSKPPKKKHKKKIKKKRLKADKFIEEGLKYCPFCHNRINTGEKFCSYCGVPFNIQER